MYVAAKFGAGTDSYVYDAKFEGGRIVVNPPLGERGDIEYQPSTNSLLFGGQVFSLSTSSSLSTSASTTSQGNTSTSSDGSEFVGKWSKGDGYDVLEISQNGDGWIVNYSSGVGSSFSTHHTYSAECVDGKLVLDTYGDITYVKSSDSILYGGNEFTRS